MVDRTIWFEWLNRDFSTDLDDPVALLELPTDIVADRGESVARRQERVRAAVQRLRLLVRRLRPGEHREAWRMLLAAIDHADVFLTEQIAFTEDSTPGESASPIGEPLFSEDTSPDEESSSREPWKRVETVTEPSRKPVSVEPFMIPPTAASGSASVPDPAISTVSRKPTLANFISPDKAGSAAKLIFMMPSESAATASLSTSSMSSSLSLDSANAPVPHISRRRFVWTARLIMLTLLAASTLAGWYYHQHRQSQNHLSPDTSTTITSEPGMDRKPTADTKTKTPAKANTQTKNPPKTQSVATNNHSGASQDQPRPAPLAPRTTSGENAGSEQAWDEPSEATTSVDPTPDTANELAAQLRSIVAEMRQRRYDESETQLATLADSAIDPVSAERVAMLRYWNDSLRTFWDGLHNIADGLHSLDELPVRNTAMLVTSVSRKKLTLRMDGTTQTFVPYSYPRILIEALLNRGADFQDENNRGLYAAFLAMDPEGDMALARQELKKLSENGFTPAADMLRAIESLQEMESDIHADSDSTTDSGTAPE